MSGNNRQRAIIFDFLGLLPVLILAFYVAFIPHLNYPYPVHHDEWMHMTYSKALMQAGSISFADPFYGQGAMVTNANMEAGFHIFGGIFQQITGISWLTIFRYFPSIIFVITALSVYVLTRREGFGWEAAFFTCLIPTSVGILGPAFLVPMAMGMLFLPLCLFLAFNFKSWPCYLLLFLFICFLLSMHPLTAVGVVIILIPYILLNLKGNFRHSLGITLALAIPFVATLPLTFKMLLPTAKLLLTQQLPTPGVNLPPLLQAYGYLPILLAFAGVVWLTMKGAKKNFGLLFGLLALLLMLILFFRFHYGLPTLYERGLTLMLLMLGIIAGAGLQWIRKIRLSTRYMGTYRAFAPANLGNIFCIFLVGLILAVSIPSHLNTYYYHMIDDEDYRAFVWIRDNMDSNYEVVLVDPWKATAFTAITGKNVLSRIIMQKEPVDDTIYQFLGGGCQNTDFLIDNRISMIYNRLSCNNTDLVEVRNNVYLLNLETSLKIAFSNLLQNAGFEAIYGNPPANWHHWSQNCKPSFQYPEPGRTGGSCVGIEMFEAEPFDPWPYAICHQDIPVTAGESYTIGGWIRTESVIGQGGAMIYPSWKEPGNTWISNPHFMSYVQGTTGWTYYQGKVTAPHGATICTVCCALEGCSGKAWFDDIMFSDITDAKP
ncbi:MAG: hypothetical protein WCD72_04215 [Dehalococcoidia bacterium]